jgi:hypothetical protein
VSPWSFLATSPVHPGDELAGFWTSPPAGAPGDYIASLELCLGSFLQSRDPSVISETSVKGLLVNVSLGFQLNFRKFIKNRQKSEKCKFNSVGFLVKKSTVSRKHVYVFSVQFLNENSNSV